ncbi:MAG TPA: LTA synthase family protein [Thermodesulfobacteriota bacterium]|nr:LTA synthase family protein [Thermodesulfobacteriota bacterium]
MKLNKPDVTKGFILLLIVVGFSIPYSSLIVEIQKDIFDIKAHWPLAIIKILVFSLFAPLAFIISLSIIKRYKLLAKVYALLYVGLYFIALLIIAIYYKYFGTIPNFMILDSTNLGSISESVSILGKQVYFQLLGAQEWLIIFLLIISVCLTYIYLRLPNTRKINGYMKAIMLIFVILVYYGLNEVQILRHRHNMHEKLIGRNAEAVLYFGFLPVYKKLISYEISNKRRVVPFPGKINGQNKRSNKIPRFKGANIIVIQVESLDSQAIDYKVNGKLVMPFLRKFKNQSVYFKNFFAQHSGGGSSDADLSTLTSLLPVPNHVGLYTADYDRIQSLVEVLEERGYTSLAMSPVSFVFHDKTSSYPRIGFDFFYGSEFYTGQASGWYAKDWQFYDQSVDTIKNSPKPFFAYLVTIQSHGPFKNYSETTKAKFNFDNTDLSELEFNYLLSVHEVDQALERFFNEILESGLLDNTILLIYGDHVGRALDRPGCLAECISLFIYHKNLPASVETKVGSHVDIAPTIVDLLDVSEPVGWLGTSLFYEGRKTVLFNDLTAIEFSNGVLQKKVATEYRHFLEYSNSIVE